jgi:hypothetical protein
VDPQNFRNWRLFTNLCFTLLLVLILAEVLAPEAVETEIGVDSMMGMEFALSLVVLLDIAISFRKAADKKAFLKKNIIKIIAVFPWGFTFRALSFLRIEAEIPLVGKAVALESEAVAVERVASGAGKGFRLFAKLQELLESL